MPNSITFASLRSLWLVQLVAIMISFETTHFGDILLREARLQYYVMHYTVI
jgi:hypothetical protein